MQILFSELKRKNVVSVGDGKNLGKVNDLAFCSPENIIKGIYVTAHCALKFGQDSTFIPICAVVKIGVDTVMVDLSKAGDKPPRPPHPPVRRDLTDYE